MHDFGANCIADRCTARLHDIDLKQRKPRFVLLDGPESFQAIGGHPMVVKSAGLRNNSAGLFRESELSSR